MIQFLCFIFKSPAKLGNNWDKSCHLAANVLLLTKHFMLFTLLKIFSCQILNAVVEAKYLSQTPFHELGYGRDKLPI